MLSDTKVHTTLPVLDMERAKRFYSEKLGLEPSGEAPGGVFYDAGSGTRFLLYPTPNPTRGGHTQLGWSVADIEATVAELRSRGVVFEEYDYPTLKTVNGIAATGDARAAWFKDSEDNLHGVIQLPPGM